VTEQPAVTKKMAGVVLAVSVALMCGQFILTFTTSVLPTDNSLATLLFHLAPYSLALASLYVLFRGQELSVRRGGIARIAIVLLASYGVAGACFLLLVVGGLVGMGPDAVQSLFSKLPILVAIGTLFVLPVVAKALR